MRVGLDSSITSFNSAGNARYVRSLSSAITAIAPEGVEFVPLTLPDFLRSTAIGVRRKALTLFWELIYMPCLLPRLAKRAGLDLLHVPLPAPIGRLACPLVITVLDVIPTLYPQWFPRLMGARLRRWLRHVADSADALITISRHTADDMRRLFPHLALPVYPITLGSFFEDAGPRPLAAASGPDRPYILTVGTLEPRKNLARVIEAYALFAQARPNPPRLAIVGGQGWGGEDAPTTARRLGVAEQVDLVGFVSDERLRELYAGATMLVYPSLYEGFGFPVLEAMSMGCPVVTSNTSSLPEIAGRAGLLVNPTDPAQIAAAMRCILEEPALASHLRQEGLRRSRVFSWDRCARETLAAYRATLQMAGRGDNAH